MINYEFLEDACYMSCVSTVDDIFDWEESRHEMAKQIFAQFMGWA